MAIDMVIGQLQKEMSTNVCTHCIKSPNRQKEILDCSYGNGAHASRQTEQLLSNSRNKKRFNSQHSSTVSGRQINVKYPRYSHSLICPMMCSHQSRKFVTVSVQLSVMSGVFFSAEIIQDRCASLSVSSCIDCIYFTTVLCGRVGLYDAIILKWLFIPQPY